jgi:hypothetical protein
MMRPQDLASFKYFCTQVAQPQGMGQPQDMAAFKYFCTQVAQSGMVYDPMAMARARMGVLPR